jgi:hypothetical protein
VERHSFVSERKREVVGPRRAREEAVAVEGIANHSAARESNDEEKEEERWKKGKKGKEGEEEEQDEQTEGSWLLVGGRVAKCF